MLLTTLMCLSCLLTQAHCLLSFINPPPSGKIGDFTKNLVFATGETVSIAWSGSKEGTAASIVLYHLNQTTGDWFSDGDMEYILQRSLAPGLFTWLVGTRKDLKVSNLFYLSIFEEGKGVSDGNSRYFNITARDVAAASTLSTSPSPSTTPEISSTTSLESNTSSSTLWSSSITIGEPTGVSRSTTGGLSPTTGVFSSATGPGSTDGSSDSFPNSAKIGLGVGIPLALLLGAAAGFLLFRRRRNEVSKTPATVQVTHSPAFPLAYPPSELYSPHKSPEEPYYARSHEVAVRSPAELR